jgi:hypothetical protein
MVVEVTLSTLIIIFLVAIILGLIMGVSLARPTIH